MSSGVEQRYESARHCIAGALTRCLGLVAWSAGERQVLQGVGTTTGAWGDVLDLKTVTRQSLWSLAVLAEPASAIGNRLIVRVRHQPAGVWGALVVR
jgi:hypothetical protein